MSARLLHPPRWLLILAACFAAANLALSVFPPAAQSRDLWNLRLEAQLIMAGENPFAIYLTGNASPAARDLIDVSRLNSSFSPDYFPSSLLPIYPLASCSWPVARSLWLIINLTTCAGLTAVLYRWWGGGRSAFALAICIWVAGTPFRTNLSYGQTCAFAPLMLMAAAWLQNRQPVLAGLILALGLVKYAFVWPLVLFLFFDRRAWKTLLVAGMVHVGVHLFLCRRIGVKPIDVLFQVLQVDSKIFHRETWLTFWSPYRALAELLPQTSVPADLLGILSLLSVVVWLMWLHRFGDPSSGSQSLGWFFMFGNLAALTFSLKWYYLIAFPAGWLWCLSLPLTRETRWRQPIILSCIFYISVVHRLLMALAGLFWNYELTEPPSLLVFNSVFCLLLVTSAFLFHRTLRPASCNQN